MTKENYPSSPNAKPLPDRQVAVAIAGNQGEGQPSVIASGRGKLAEQILAIAFERGIKVREDADLAEVLAALDLDTDIPTEAIMAVADILTRVYQENDRMAAGDSAASLSQNGKTESNF